MNSPGILALSIYKPSDGTTYQLDGSKIAVDSEGYICERNIIDTAKGTERKKNAKHTFEIRHSDSSFQSTFLADADAGNRSWNLVIAELDGFVLWYENSNVNCTIEEAYIDPSNEGFPYVIRMTSYGTAIARGTNLLYAYNKTQGFASAWQDSDSNGFADGLFITDIEANSFSNNIQNVQNTDSNLSYINSKIILPISGIDLIASATYTINSGVGRLQLQCRTFSESQVLNVVDDISNGIDNVNGTTPSTTYFIYVYWVISSSSANFNIDFSFPTVRLNDSAEYVDG